MSDQPVRHEEVAEKLEDAADLLEKEGWIQGALYFPFTGEDDRIIGRKYCAVGALAFTVDENFSGIGELMEKKPVFAAAVLALRNAIDDNGPLDTPSSSVGYVEEWNDDDDRHKQQVLDLFRKAAKEERKLDA